VSLWLILFLLSYPVLGHQWVYLRPAADRLLVEKAARMEIRRRAHPTMSIIALIALCLMLNSIESGFGILNWLMNSSNRRSL
jgi:hypothetical protein